MKTLEGLRKGYTTGTCAQASAKASALMLGTKRKVKKIEVITPSGVKINLKVLEPQIGKNYARCCVIKDAGDDVDITNGIKVYAEVRYCEEKGILIKGGKGIGIITKPGLAVSMGEYAINPIPREAIIKELSACLPEAEGIEVIISVPEGEKLASRTFNPRLGISGGISILGTTGIVEPKSTDAFKTSLSLQLEVLKASGYGKAILVFGYVGEKFCREMLQLKQETIIRIGDHVGFVLTECVKKEIKEVQLVGYLGKMIKVARGQFNTHIKFGDHRILTIADFAENAGAAGSVVQAILSQTTAEAAIEILIENGLTGVFQEIAEKVVSRINELVNSELTVNCILLSLQGKLLARYPGKI